MNWREIPSLSALRAFEAVARAGSISAAANTLNVTHAAIAQHVRALETQLGVKLTQRSGRSIDLTTDGKALADTLTEGFGLIHAGINAMKAAKEDAPLSITTTPSFAENWLMPRLGHFWAEHPEITLSISPSSAVVDLAREPLDIAIRYGRGDWPGLSSAFLVDADYVVVAAPQLLNGQQAKSIAELQDMPWLFEIIHQEARSWALDNGLDLKCCQLKEFQTLGMVLSALRAGVGASVVSRALVAKDIEAGTLSEIANAPPGGKGYYIVHRQDVMSERAKIFKRWLLKAT